MMVDAPRLDDPRMYCVECYAYLFPPGWTDEYQPLTYGDSVVVFGDPEPEQYMEEPCEHEMHELPNGMAQCIFCGVIED